jgi:nitrate/nitrite transport system ATP-binding protein
MTWTRRSLLADRIIALNPDGTLGRSSPSPSRARATGSEMNGNDTFKRLRADVTAYLMDVGIEAQGRRHRDAARRHADPRRARGRGDAQQGMIETNRFLDFSQAAQGLSDAQGAADRGRGFRPQDRPRASSSR